MRPDAPHDIAIIGGGAAGTLVALHLLRLARTPLRIALVEPAPVAEGVAYATRFAEHVLNVSAARMSVFDDRPDDFVAYLAAGTGPGHREGLGERFAQRRQYAPYLRQRLQEARDASLATLELVADRAIACHPEVNGGELIELASGRVLAARHVVLALGNTARTLPLPAATNVDLPAGVVLQAWDYPAIKAIDRDADVTVVGAGLSMVDVALSLADNGHRGRLHVVSRHGLLPLPHAPLHEVADLDVDALLAMPLRQRMRVLRREATRAAQAGVAWQSLMNSLRPHVRRLWQSLSFDDQRRFRRHVARQWDVHRHRIAPHVAARLEAMRGAGQLRLHRGRLVALCPREDGVEVAIAGRRDGTGESPAQRWSSTHIINAVGVELQVARMGHTVLGHLAAHGRLRPGPHGLGADTAADGALLDASGQPQAALSALGSLRIGSLLESIAVPDLRQDAQALATRLLVLST